MLRDSLAAFRSLDDPSGVARAAWALGTMHVQGIGRTREELLDAKTYINLAYAAHRTLGNRFDLAWDLHGLGLAELKLGELDSAGQRWLEALDSFMEVADSSGIVIMLSNLGELARVRGDRSREATLVGAASAVAARTGVGLASVIRTTEQRPGPDDIAPEHRAALDRGLAMTDAEAVAFARAAEHAPAV